MRTTHGPHPDLVGWVARATLVVAPLLAFGAFSLPGIATLAMVLPLCVLGLAYLTTPGLRFPAPELLVAALLGLSVLWGDDPDYSAERLRTYLPLIVATVVAGTLVPRAVVLRCLKVSMAIMIISSLAFIALNPAGAVQARGADLLVSGQFAKNTYGGLVALGLLLLLDVRRRANLLLAPGLVALLVLNRSVTAWVVAAMLVLATYAVRSIVGRLPRSTAEPVLAVLTVSGLGGAMLLANANLDSALGAVGKDPTLGLRTEIWAACWAQIKDAPLLGHGAFTFLDSASGSPVTQFVWARFNNYRPPHPHNGLLDLLGQLGIIGVAAFAVMMFHGFRHGLRGVLEGSETARAGVLVLAFVLVFGATEPTYLDNWLIVAVIAVAVVAPRTNEPPGTVPSERPDHRRTLERTP